VHGIVGKAAKTAGVGRVTVYAWRNADPDFAAAWDSAVEQSTDLLEHEARRRAFTGTLKPVFQGGKRVGEVREFSDTLLIFLLKGRRPKTYRDSTVVTVAGDAAAPVCVRHEKDIDRAEAIATILAGVGALAAPGGAGTPPGGDDPEKGGGGVVPA
jgi:hypothetical protein